MPDEITVGGFDLMAPSLEPVNGFAARYPTSEEWTDGNPLGDSTPTDPRWIAAPMLGSSLKALI